MYHVSNDVRAKKSAELIRIGLEKCLTEKPLNKIKINDIYEKCYVSRATFYRLFDGINDVFAYECDMIFLDIVELLKNKIFKDKNEQALYCIKRWLTHETLIKALVENNLVGVFYESHMRNSSLLKGLYSIPIENESEFDYFISILASLSYASLSIYFEHGATEPIEVVYNTICHCTGIIANNLSQ